MSDSATIRRARVSDLPSLVPLFEGYRAFYGRAAAPRASAKFLAERLKRRDALLWVAERAGAVIGFVQVYPIFSSLSARRAWILNDLFVAPAARTKGVGRQLIRVVAAAARQQRVAYVELATQNTNKKAQRLYASEGYQRDREFQHWSLSTTS